MLRRALLLLLAGILAIPPARHVVLELSARDVDRTTERWRDREATLARAKVFVPDSPDLRTVDLTRNPGDPRPIASDEVLTCRYQPKPISGTTVKFDCRLENGDVVKVKYGWSRERQGEIAATRLLAALGFPADRVSPVSRVRCIGCPPSPFKLRVVAEQFLAGSLLDYFLTERYALPFEWVSVERKLEGREIEVDEFEGWDWRELPLVSAAKGGATPAELDALRLISVFLAHWDNKNTNHRLLCLGDSEESAGSSCRYPVVMLQDVGATFGPAKVEYATWRATPIWADRASCLVSMESMPYEGILFPPLPISEAGRALLAAKLTQLSERQIHNLFMAAGFPDPLTGAYTGQDLTPWVRAFQDKVGQIAGRKCTAGPT